MDSRVDLTEQRVFSGGIINRSNVKFHWKKRPWQFNRRSTLETFNPYQPEVILTGNKYERLRKRRELAFMSGFECERCGKDLTNKPWERGRYGICIACNDHLKGTSIFEHRCEGWVGFEDRHRRSHFTKPVLTELTDLTELNLALEALE